MKNEMSLVKQNSRQNWSDLDWANYLNCPITEIPSIKNYMQENYSSLISTNMHNGKRFVRLYRHEITPSESIRPIQIYSAELHTPNFVREANDKISTLELTDFWAKALNVPKRALQMMLIRE